jgi:hypothetical protein
MKINEGTRFPHPVLSSETGDYQNGEFLIDVMVEEALQPSQVTLHCTVTLTEPTLSAAVADGNAAVGLFVTCLDSYLSRPVTVGLAGGPLSFEPGELIGRVTLRPMIWSRKAITEFSLANCHPEFGTGFIGLPAGSVLAVDDPITINVGREKLAQMETIFSLVEAPHLTNGRLAVELDSERIKILAAADIYQQLNSLRGMGTGNRIVLNSVYLPAVMEVLNILQGGASGYEGRRWHRVFMAKCEHLGIKLANADLWFNAQRLLEMPFLEISKSAEIFGA